MKRSAEGHSNSPTSTVSTLKLQNHVCSFSFRVQFTKPLKTSCRYMIKLMVTTSHQMKQISDSPPVWLIVSIFHNVKCSVTNVTQTTAWCNLRESRSEVRVQFSRVYLSPSCSTSATCASSCDLPPRQRTSTWQSWENSGWWGWG